jgi:hypothetical protein
MYIKNYDESAAQGIVHAEGWAKYSIEKTLGLLSSGEGSRSGCLRNLILISEG